MLNPIRTLHCTLWHAACVVGFNTRGSQAHLYNMPMPYTRSHAALGVISSAALCYVTRLGGGRAACTGKLTAHTQACMQRHLNLATCTSARCCSAGLSA